MKFGLDSLLLHELTTQATFLNPRFKRYRFLSTNAFETTLNNIRQRVSHIRIGFELPRPEENLSDQVAGRSHQITTSDNSLLWGTFDNTVKHVLANPNPQAATIIEVDKYLNEPLIDRNLCIGGTNANTYIHDCTL